MIKLLFNRLRVFQQFTIGELIELVVGKFFSARNSGRFNRLQQREINLVKILQIDDRAIIGEQEAEINHPVSNKLCTFFLRMVGSDIWVFNQVFQSSGYAVVDTLYTKFYGAPPTTFVDAGANIGLVSIYFVSLNPEMRILAIEPDPENCRMARKNFSANRCQNIELFEQALWPTQTNLKLVNDFRDQLNWSLRVEEDNSGGITTITPEAVIRYFDQPVDIMKIDIEGGEDKLFGHACDLNWLTQIKIIAIEIHDEQTDRERITSMLKSSGFSLEIHGELTIGINTRTLSA
ncbi:MAG: FkbM family methyltransferase [Cyclobacteriaceae bacterium]|nr:FkbM family methyltransferase [Cyclobacteriaceae bacterium]